MCLVPAAETRRARAAASEKPRRGGKLMIRWYRSAAAGAAALLSGASLLVLAGPAMAESAGAPQAESNSQVTEVVVTARKRAESLQDVPVSVAAVGEAALDHYDLTKVTDLTNKLSNFIIPNAAPPTLTDVSVRGVNVNVRNAGFNPSVSFYVDGVYQGRPSNFNQMLFDVDHVELLLGPQGTLFGNNTIAGVVNIVNNRPTATAGGYVEAGIGNYDLRELQMVINAPISDNIFTRLSGIIQERDGYEQNLYTGKDQGNLNRGGLRWQILGRSERSEAHLTVAYQQGHERPPVQEYIEQGVSVFPATPPFDDGYNAAPEPFRFLQDPSTSDFERFDAYLNLKHELAPGLNLISLTAYKDTKTTDEIDQDIAADPRLKSDMHNIEKQQILSQELRLESDPSKRFSYVAGFYFLNDRVSLDRTYSYYPPFIILGPIGALGLGINAPARMNTDTYAGFGNIQYDILPKLELSAGLRYSYEDMHTAYDQAEVFRTLGDIPTNQVLPLGPGGGILIANAPTYIDSRTDGLWSGTGTLTYHFDPERMVYARYARGTKSGGFNLEPLPNPLPPDRRFGKETLDNFELGGKSQWWDNRLKVNLTAFLQKYHDLQRADLIPIEISPGVTASTQVIRNAAEVEVKGVEATVELVPVDGLHLYANYGRANAKFIKYEILSGADLSGQALTGVPTWNADIGGDYRYTFANGFMVDAGVSAEFRGKRLLGPADSVAVGVAGYHVINAQVTVTPPNGRWELNFWANNLTDELYVTSMGSLSGFYNSDVVGFGVPRMYGATLKVRFGD
jgi:iron complex outermembrane receptor protein